MTTPARTVHRRRTRSSQAAAVSLEAQYPTYTPLGSNGLPYIAAVPTSAEDADQLSDFIVGVAVAH